VQKSELECKTVKLKMIDKLGQNLARTNKMADKNLKQKKYLKNSKIQSKVQSSAKSAKLVIAKVVR